MRGAEDICDVAAKAEQLDIARSLPGPQFRIGNAVRVARVGLTGQQEAGAYPLLAQQARGFDELHHALVLQQPCRHHDNWLAIGLRHSPIRLQVHTGARHQQGLLRCDHTPAQQQRAIGRVLEDHAQMAMTQRHAVEARHDSPQQARAAAPAREHEAEPGHGRDDAVHSGEPGRDATVEHRLDGHQVNHVGVDVAHQADQVSHRQQFCQRIPAAA